MQGRAKAFGHAIHPMLIVFPLGLLTTAVIFDILHLITDRHSFEVSAAHTMGVGILGGLAAALFGLLDWLAIPSDTRARRIGVWHGLGNVVVVGLFAVSWLLRVSDDNWNASGLAITLGFIAIAIALVTSWLGGELVERLGVGVAPDAGVNAPSSLARHGR